MTAITANVNLTGGITANVTIDRRTTISPISIENVAIVKNTPLPINTNQSARKPIMVFFYDEVANKNVHIPGWTARLNTTWFIDIPAILKDYTNLTVSYL